MDSGIRQATVHGVAKSRTWLSMDMHTQTRHPQNILLRNIIGSYLEVFNRRMQNHQNDSVVMYVAINAVFCIYKQKDQNISLCLMVNKIPVW